jgi:hypothetical protein
MPDCPIQRTLGASWISGRYCEDNLPEEVDNMYGIKGRVRHLKKFVGMILLLFIWGTSSINGQEGSKDDPRRPLAPEDISSTPSGGRGLPYYSPKDPVECEVADFYLDDARIRAQEIPGGYIIVIARLGSGEISRQLNLSRLKAVDTYLKRSTVTRFVTAEGARTEGLGRLEFYVNGKRLYVLPIKKNGRLDLFSCRAV